MSQLNELIAAYQAALFEQAAAQRAARTTAGAAARAVETRAIADRDVLVALHALDRFLAAARDGES